MAGKAFSTRTGSAFVLGGGPPDQRAGVGDDVDEEQRSLFSWAEFLAEEQGARRSRKPKPASTSLFGWGFSLEQEREQELVGAGR